MNHLNLTPYISGPGTEALAMLQILLDCFISPLERRSGCSVDSARFRAPNAASVNRFQLLRLAFIAS